MLYEVITVSCLGAALHGSLRQRVLDNGSTIVDRSLGARFVNPLAGKARLVDRRVGGDLV